MTQDTWYNGQLVDPDTEEMLSYNNKIVGAARFRQQRVQKDKYVGIRGRLLRGT